MDTNNSAKCTGLRLPTTKELLMEIRSSTLRAINALRNAETVNAIREILDQIYGYQIPNRNQIPMNIQRAIDDYRGATRQVMMHTRTLDTLIEDLTSLISILDDNIKNEEKRESSNALRIIFTRLAENADEVFEFLKKHPDANQALQQLAENQLK